jgi:hypothetical protein
MGVLLLVIVAELDIVCVAVDETKTNAPLIVHRYRMLSRSVVLQRVQPITWRHSQICELSRHVHVFQPSKRTPRQAAGDSFRLAGPKQLFGPSISERFDHEEM